MNPARYRGMAQGSVALSLGLLVGALGALVLIGWGFDVAVLKCVFPGLVSMKANTAMGMLLGGVSLAILSREKVAAPARFWTTLMTAAMVAVGTLTLSEYLWY